MNIPEVYLLNTEWLLMMAGQKASHIAESLLKPLGVSVREMTVMKIVDGREISQQEIASIIGINRNAIVDVADALETKSLAERQKNPDNRRQQFVVLTKKGTDLVQRWDDCKSSERFWVRGVLSRAECDVFHSMLIKLLEHNGETKF